MNQATTDALNYLTLGDGDFSFSLDLAQYLFSSSLKSDKAGNDIVLVATSVDSSQEVLRKYHDFEFISSKLAMISKISSANKIKNDKNNTIFISIHHNINAIINESGETLDKTFQKNQFNHVIFNHPHLGKESASLHNRFLSHYFHSCYNYWLKPGGVVHLTLVKEQCERWFCLESASKQGFTLLNRFNFRPPPPNYSSDEDDAVSYYQHRRHQSGKSFASRTEGSEVLTFGRKNDQNNYISKCLPWYEAIDTNGESKTSTNEKRKIQSNSPKEKMFQCNQCPKTFREERSLKNHVQNVHRANSVDEKIIFSCDLCHPPRKFKTKEGLNDHKLSKHFGKFTDIKPDWCASKISENCIDLKSNEAQNFGCCSICLQSYSSMKEKDDHLLQFIPSLENVKEIWECNICSKKFCDERALLQHMNHCNYRHAMAK